MSRRSVTEEIGERIKSFTKSSPRPEKKIRVEGRRLDKNQFEKRHDKGVRLTMNRRERSVEGYEDDEYDDEEGFQTDSTASWIVGTVFLTLIIFVLSPGVLLTIPPTKGGIFMSGNTSKTAAFVHALLIVLLLHFI